MDDVDAVRAQAAALLTASEPGKTNLPTAWPGWARLLPHLLAFDPGASTEGLSNLAIDAIWYLIRCGLARNARQLASLDEDTVRRCRSVLGEDHPDTLTSAESLVADLRALSEGPDGPGV